ncbi:MAG TPA: hypothetical protein VIQ04_03640, partial [Nitrososphaeraceae archaeon]
MNSSLPKILGLERREKKHCTKCDADISYANWSRHQRSTKHLVGKKEIATHKSCDHCNKTITSSNWARHLKSNAHLNNKGNVNLRKVFNFKDSLFKESQGKVKLLQETKHRKPHRVFNFSNLLFEEPKKKHIVEEAETAFASRLKTYNILNTKGYKDVRKFLDNTQNIIEGKIKHTLKYMDMKVNMVLVAEYKKGVDKDNMEYLETNFKTKNEIIVKATNLTDYYSGAKDHILNEMESFETRGSQWTLNKIHKLELRLNKYNPLKGSSYIPLPKVIDAKKAIINVKNGDNKCFLWSVLSALHPAEQHSYRVSQYKKFEHEFDAVLRNIEFPVKISDIGKFEKATDISVNVYHLDDYKNVLPLRITENENDKHIDLLYIKEADKEHYCWIKNLWKLVGKQLTKNCLKRHL